MKDKDDVVSIGCGLYRLKRLPDLPEMGERLQF